MLTLAISVLGLLVVGMVLYILDRNFGVAFKRGLYNLTHKNKMPKEMECGFIFGRLVKARVIFAAVLAVVQLLGGVFVFHVDVINALLATVGLVLVLPFGFYLGPYADWLMGNANAFLDNVEAMEKRVQSGQTTLGSELRSGVQTVAGRARGAYEDVKTASGAASGKPDTSAPVSPKEDPGAKRREEDEQGRKAFERFTGRDKGGN